MDHTPPQESNATLAASLDTLKARLSLASTWRESYSLAGRSVFELLQAEQASIAVLRPGGKRIDVHGLTDEGVDESPDCIGVHGTVYGQVLLNNRADYEPWLSSLVVPIQNLGSTSGALHVLKSGTDMFEPHEFDLADRLVEIFSAELHRFERRSGEVSPLAGSEAINAAFAQSTADQLSWL